MQEGPERIDYNETPDVTEVHAAVKREHGDPRADVTPIPLWLTGLCAVAVAWAGAYLGVFHGGFSANVFDENQSSPALLFPVASTTGANTGAAAGPVSLADIGKGVYSNCVPCHQGSGLGVPGTFPPLAGSEWVVGSEKRLIAILLKGVHEPLTVAGKQFPGAGAAMQAWESALTDKKIAGVATYIRSNFGNSAPEISEAKVKAARAEFADRKTQWTEAELKQIPENATLPDAEGAAPAPAAAPAGAPAAAPGAPAANAPAPAAGGDPMALGKMTYMTICIACHQPTGAGLPLIFPPLTKSPYANGSPERFAAIVLKGNIGPFTVDNKPFNNVMPGLEAGLDDAKIAAVMTFVRANFENSAPPVSPDVVAAARKKFTDRKTSWTQPELDAWKE
jgi:mono/diheme cytochrome c family protein